jgi:hypothetical protein
MAAPPIALQGGVMSARAVIMLLVVTCLAACGSQEVGPASVVGAAHKNQDKNETSCPGADFASFLKSFSADENVRRKFTAQTVAVTDWKDIDDTNQGVTTLSVSSADYQDFSLRYSDGAYHHASADGNVDPAPLDVLIKPRTDGTFLVGYSYGMSEGNSWLFSPAEDCWRLTADPEPPVE